MTRAIDRLPQPAFVREKKVIVVAKSRTGTLSIYKALQILGYRAYHGAEIMAHGVSHLEIITEAMNAKYFGVGEPYGKKEFDKWFADYDALVEIPAAFIEEITTAYPDAKYIHVERDVDQWYKSVMNTLGHSLKAVDESPLKELRLTDNFIDKYCAFYTMVRRVMWHDKSMDDGESVLKQDYLDLNFKVNTLISKDRLTSFHLEDGFGWQQLCSVLNEPVPDKSWPRANTPENFGLMQKAFVERMASRVTQT